MLALFLVGWNLLLGLGIAYAIVWLMKGPAFVADAYHLSAELRL